MLLRIIALGLLVIVARPVRADPPFAMYLFPAGGQRGTTVHLLAGGACLTPSCNFEILGSGVEAPRVVKRTTCPDFEGPFLSLPESQRAEDYPRAMSGAIKIAPAATVGNRFVRMWTSQGVTLPLTFVVGELPEVIEKEVDGKPVPTAVEAPITINGRIYPREDVDIWTVKLKKGQTLYGYVSAVRIGSPLEARLAVHDPTGRKILESRDSLRDDPKLEWQAAEDGEYQVHISDARSEGGPAFVYRLTLTQTPIAPPLVLNELNETGGGVLAIPFIKEGIIAKPGEVDSWQIEATKGDAFDIDLNALRLGSPLLGSITVVDSNGKTVAQAEAAAGDPSLRFVAPTAGTFIVNVQDRFKSRGGLEFVYRLKVAPSLPDFELQTPIASLTVLRGAQTPMKITALRRGGFTGAIFLNFDGLPAGITLAREAIIPANQISVDIPLKADTSAKVETSLLTITGMAMFPCTPSNPVPRFVSRPAVCRVNDDDIGPVRIAVALPTPFKIAGDYFLRLVPRGTQYSRHYRIERKDFDGPIEVELADRQARHLQGVISSALTVPARADEFDYTIYLPPWMETGRTCRVCVMGTATVKDADGSEHVVTYSSKEQNDQMIAVVEPERLTLQLEKTTLRVEPGKEIEVAFSISRSDDLKGPVMVRAASLLPGVTIEDVLVPAAGTKGRLKIRMAAELKGPFYRPIVLTAMAEEAKKPIVAEAKMELVAR